MFQNECLIYAKRTPIVSFERDVSRRSSTIRREGLLLTCPGKRPRVATLPSVVDQSDYIYANWEPFLGTNDVPDNYPLIYDKHMANHSSMGINVLTRRGPSWDFRARSLARFAKEYPKYGLVVPD